MIFVFKSTMISCLLLLSHFTFIASGYNLACFNHPNSYDWDALRNATAPEHLPQLDVGTAHRLIIHSLEFPLKELRRECLVGDVVLRILTLIYVSDFDKMQHMKRAYPWFYLQSILVDRSMMLSRLLWSHWNLFGVFHLFLRTLPNVPLPEMERYTDKQAMECVKGENGTFHECPASLITHGVMKSEDPELKAAGHLLLMRRIVSESFNNTCDEDINSVLAWKSDRWSGDDGIQDMAKKYLLASLPDATMFQGCDEEGSISESLPACWPSNVWGGRLVIPLLERMTKEWMSYALGTGRRSTSEAMKRIHTINPHQADFIHASLLGTNQFQVLTDHFLHITPSVTRNDRIVLSTAKKCWVVGFKAHACAHPPPPTAEAQCFNKAYPKARCCDEDVGEEAEAEAGTRDEKGNPLGTWATILFARDQASAQLLSETVCVLAYQIRGLEGSLHRPFVALTDRQTLEVLSTDIRARLLEQGVRLKTVSKKILDLEDPRIPPHHTRATLGDYSNWHKLYLWDPDLWEDLNGGTVPVFYLDSDTFPVHKGILEAFSLPPSITLGMGYNTPFRHVDGELEMNAGVMVVHPNHHIFTLMADKILSQWGFPASNEQSWLDTFFRHFSVRHEMKVPGPHWDVWYTSALNDTKGHMITSRWEPRTIGIPRILPHIILPSAYNFVLAIHLVSKLLDYKVIDQLETGAHRDMLRELGYGTDRPLPRLFHFAGLFTRPWHRCSKAVRSSVDVMWWQAHALMCSKSAYKPCFLECDQ